MNQIYDTNIVLAIIRSKKTSELLHFLNPEKKKIFVSVAIEAELKSIAMQNRWGENRILKLDYFLDMFSFIDITKSLINTYVQIDTYSQRRSSDLEYFNFDIPRNMGKNDLWIASTTALLGLELVTTDTDFDHLNNVFFEVRQIKLEDLKQFF